MDKNEGYSLLPAPIRRVFYLSSEGTGQEHEVMPKANSQARGKEGAEPDPTRPRAPPPL